MIEGVSIYYTVMTAIEEHMAQEGKGKKGKGRKKKSGTHDELSIEELLLKVSFLPKFLLSVELLLTFSSMPSP